MSQTQSLEDVRKSPEYRAVRKQLADREWRIDNLYWIKNKDGVPVPFRRNLAQRTYAAAEWFRDTILKSRKLGFSSYIALEILDGCLFSSNATADIIDRTTSDAEEKLGIVRFAYERLPASIRQGVGLTKNNNSEMVFSNGSSVGAGVSSRGGTPQMLHISEYGPISADNPNKAKEIKSGSITSVPKNGKVWAESTAKGTAGEFYDLVKAGEQLKASGQQLTQLDFKLHFFGWYNDPDNRLPVNLVLVPAEMHEYFDTLEKKFGVKTDGQQRAWYTKTREFLGPDEMRSEHPSSPDECFYASLEGAYFKEEMNAARRDGRIGKPVPYDNTRPVHTFWDLGMDGNMAIGFMQTDGVRHRAIDFAKGEHSGLSEGIKIVKDKNATRGFVYGQHYGPHDLDTRDWSNMSEVTAKSRKEVAAEYGINFTVMPRVSDKQDAIDAARRMIASTWFCSDYAGGLVECLDNYTRGWNKLTSQWLPTPAKNGFDHGADAYMQIAMGLSVDDSTRGRHKPFKKKGSFWSN